MKRSRMLSGFAAPLAFATACATVSPATHEVEVKHEAEEDSPVVQLAEENARYAEIFKEAIAAMECADTCEAMAREIGIVLESNGGIRRLEPLDHLMILGSEIPDYAKVVGRYPWIANYDFPRQDAQSHIRVTQGLSGKEFLLREWNGDVPVSEKREQEMAEALEPTAQIDFTVEQCRQGFCELVVLSGGASSVEKKCTLKKRGQLPQLDRTIRAVALGAIKEKAKAFVQKMAADKGLSAADTEVFVAETADPEFAVKNLAFMKNVTKTGVRDDMGEEQFSAQSLVNFVMARPKDYYLNKILVPATVKYIAIVHVGGENVILCFDSSENIIGLAE